jgi:hypothetical protein
MTIEELTADYNWKYKLWVDGVRNGKKPADCIKLMQDAKKAQSALIQAQKEAGK